MIMIKSQKEIELMRQASNIVAQTLSMVEKHIKPDITTGELDRLVEEKIRSMGATPSFKGYHGFPASACVSVNDEVVHGIPGIRRIKKGDIVSVDIGACFEGYHGDAARTFAVEDISSEAKRLIDVTTQSFFEGLKYVRPGFRVGDISVAIQNYVESNGYSVVRKLVGHGVGAHLHEQPDVPNFGLPGRGSRLLPGMTLAIEPMVNAGGYDVNVLSNNWTVATSDGSLSAHYENTVLITKGEPELLTVLR